MNYVGDDSRDLVELMRLADTEGVISFSGGFPSPDTYPVEDIKETMIEILRDDARGALSYSPPSGCPELRGQIAARMKKNFGLDFDADRVILVSGSQQGLDLSGLLFIDPGDVILFETPSYLGALNALKTYEAALVAIPTDEGGMVLDEVEKAFARYGDRIKLIYVNTDHQNPTGRSWSQERRRDFIGLVKRYDVAVLEDAAYAELSFSDVKQKPLIAYDDTGRVIYLGTFSKTFCPGLRTGWICGAREIIDKYLTLKTSVDLSPATILQRQLAYYLRSRDLDAHIRGICALYKRRRDVMLAAIGRDFPPQASYKPPEGGLFFWVSLPEACDTREILKRAAAEKVAFVPGGAFYPDAGRNNEMRLNFSNMPEEDIVKGIAILGRIIREYIAALAQ
jgi:DNA-binding transcriptional MocR family regulator